jgi:hypothetical protein
MSFSDSLFCILKKLVGNYSLIKKEILLNHEMMMPSFRKVSMIRVFR